MTRAKADRADSPSTRGTLAAEMAWRRRRGPSIVMTTMASRGTWGARQKRAASSAAASSSLSLTDSAMRSSSR